MASAPHNNYGRFSRETLQPDPSSSAPKCATWGELIVTASVTIGGIVGSVLWSGVTKAQLVCSFIIGAGTQRVCNLVLPAKWRHIANQQLMRIGVSAYVVTVQIYLNAQNAKRQNNAFQFATVLLGMELIAIVDSLWNHHKKRASLLPDTIPISIGNSGTITEYWPLSSEPALHAEPDPNARFTLFCQYRSGWNMVELSTGAVALAVSTIIPTDDEKKALEFFGSFLISSVIGRTLWEKVERLYFLLEQAFEEAHTRAALEGNAVCPDRRLRLLRFLRKFLQIASPFLSGALFTQPYWQTAIPIGLLFGAQTENSYSTFLNTPIHKFLNTQQIQLTSREKIALYTWKVLFTVAETGALLWFTSEIMKDPEARLIDKIVFMNFPLFYWLSYVSCFYVGKKFIPGKSSNTVTQLFYHTLYKPGSFIIVFLYINSANIKIGDESLSQYSMKNIAIPCLGWASFGWGLGEQSGWADYYDRRLGPEITRIPSPIVMLLAEWMASGLFKG